MHCSITMIHKYSPVATTLLHKSQLFILKTHLELIQTPKMELFAKIANGFQQGCNYPNGYSHHSIDTVSEIHV